jgi:hypothetical protein
MTADSDQSDAKVIEGLIADVSACCEKFADAERRLSSLHARYVVDSPLVRGVAQVRSGQEAILEALQRIQPTLSRRARRTKR